MAEIALVVTVLAVVAALVARRIRRDARRMQALLERGEIAQATICDVRRERRSRVHDDFFVSYTFSARDGATYTRRNRVTPGDFGGYVEGQRIEIVYDRDDPRVSLLKLTVDEARRAMHRTAIR